MLVQVLLFLSVVANIFLLFFLLRKKQTPQLKAYQDKEREWLQESSLLKAQIEQLERELANQKNIYEEQFKQNLEREKQNYNERLNEKEQHFKQIQEQNKQQFQTKEEFFKNQLEREKQDREQYFKKLKTDFENISNQILKNKTEHFQKESERSLSNLLNPLKEEIQKFEDRYNKESKERFSLKEEIEKIADKSDNLTQALKGDTRTQGAWGELVLENILKNSGLRKGKDFIVQGKGLNLKNEEGQPLKPDVIVKLPDKRWIVIDSKVSLTSYYKYTSAQDAKEKEEHIKGIVRSLENHIDNLSSKQYHKAEGLNTSDSATPDFTLMFLPLEGALSLAIQNERHLFNKAWEKSIAIVSPITLYSSLKIINTLWKIDSQNKNARAIAEESGKLFNKIAGFVNDMENIGKSLDKAQESHNTAFKKLKGRGNLIDRAKKIKELGAKTDKSLPASTEDYENTTDQPEKSVPLDIEEFKNKK